MADAITIDGFGPLPVHRPTNAIEIGELVRGHSAIYPHGGGTLQAIGRTPMVPGIVLDTSELNRVIDYPARDMTVTVQAGMTLSALAGVLSGENQWLPIDVPDPLHTSVGAALATNTNGPRRLNQGTWRDAIIGIRFVADDGVECKGGGRVVKNVAGYDLMKLHTGALGTLGIITEVTLKVKPRPERSGLVTFGVSAAAVGPTLDRLHASFSRPVAIELLNRGAAKSIGIEIEEPWLIACGFEEKSATVQWQLDTLKSESAGSPLRDFAVIEGELAGTLWRGLAALQAGKAEFVSLVANGRPSQIATRALTADAAHSRAIVHAHAGNGILFVHTPEEFAADRVAKFAKELVGDRREENVRVLKCPPSWKPPLPVWGFDRGDRKLMASIRATLDPNRKFNPGRVDW